MPRGIPKTHEENVAELRERREWVERQPSLNSPCLEGRRKHQFRNRKTRGPLTIRDHGEQQCFWCRKTFAQVKREQRKKSK